MPTRPGAGTIRTARLELVPLTRRFVDAIVAGDRATAGAEIGARVSRWPTSDASHLVQLHLAQQAGEAEGFPGLGRVVVLVAPRGARRMIGWIGFHGVPDDHGRLELGCRIHPAHHGQGYAAEAVTALVDWATVRIGITRFLAAVSSRRGPGDLVPLEVADRKTPPNDAGALATLLERSGEP